MTDLQQRKRPGMALAGFTVPFALQLAVMAAFRAGYFADAGWRGGEYAYAFIGVALGSIVVGCALKLARPPWNSVGTGAVLAGALGSAIVVTVFALVLVAFSRWSQT